MPQVILIRPGCTDFDDQNRIQGSIELPLNQKGQEQLQEVVDRLRDTPMEVIYSSPAQPARCTAEAIAAELGVPVKLKDELRNLDQGLWEGLQVDEVRFKYPKVFRQWQESPETICPPEGETIPEAVERVREVLRKPIRRIDCFGVVVSEPLATLLYCALTGRKLEMPEPACRRPHMEIIDVAAVDGSGAEIDTMDSIEFDALHQRNGGTILSGRHSAGGPAAPPEAN